MIAFEFERAPARLFGLVRNDVVVDEREPESAARAAGLEVRAAGHERVLDVGRRPDIELRTHDVAAAPGRDEGGARDEESRENDGDGRSGNELCVRRARATVR